MSVESGTPYGVEVKRWKYGKHWLTPAREIDLVDEATGEVKGTALNSTFSNHYRDATRFVKLYDADVLLQLSKQGIGVFAYIVKQLGYGDSLYISIDECKRMNRWNSAKSVYNGLNELLALDVLRKDKERKGMYFINPNVVYRGDRQKIIRSQQKAEP